MKYILCFLLIASCSKEVQDINPVDDSYGQLIMGLSNGNSSYSIKDSLFCTSDFAFSGETWIRIGYKESFMMVDPGSYSGSLNATDIIYFGSWPPDRQPYPTISQIFNLPETTGNVFINNTLRYGNVACNAAVLNLLKKGGSVLINNIKQ